VAAAVCLFVRAGMINTAFDQLLQVGDYSAEKKKKSLDWDNLIGAYWCIVTALYLYLSFESGRWAVTWIIFIAAAGLHCILEAIIDRKNK